MLLVTYYLKLLENTKTFSLWTRDISSELLDDYSPHEDNTDVYPTLITIQIRRAIILKKLNYSVEETHEIRAKY